MVFPLLVGCGQAREAATGAANDAVSQVGKTTAAEVQRQICAPVKDGQISAQDKQVLTGLVSTATSLGVPKQITTPLGEIAKSGDQVPADSVAALEKACA